MASQPFEAPQRNCKANLTRTAEVNSPPLLLSSTSLRFCTTRSDSPSDTLTFSSHTYKAMAPSAPSDSASTSNGNSHNGVNGDKAAVSSFPTGSTAQPNSESFFDDNSDFLNLITPPKFETVEEERKYLKEKLAASLRIFASFKYDHHVVRMRSL